ncbi:MAG: hypothetical protein ACYTHM_01710 [Planctomycetota bacterium]|jgi:hypothetical protein
MRKGRIAAGFIGLSLLLAGGGAGIAGWALGGEAGRSAVLGVGMGWLGMFIGFVILLPNMDRSMNRFLGAYVAGLLLRLGLLGAAVGMAVAGWGSPAPLLLGMAFTVFGLLMLEGVILLAGAPRS